MNTAIGAWDRQQVMVTEYGLTSHFDASRLQCIAVIRRYGRHNRDPSRLIVRFRADVTVPTDPVQRVAEMKVRVLHIASGDLWAGAEVQLYNLATAQLALPDILVSVVLMNEGVLERRLRDAGISVHVCDERVHGLLGLLSAVRRVCRDFSPNVIHTHRRKENLLGALVSMGTKGVVSLRTVHGADEGPRDSFKHKFLDWSDYLVGKKLQQRVVAVSPSLESALREKYGAAHMACIENGIEVASVRRESGTAHPLPTTDRIRVGFAGRLVPVKRVDVFLRLAAELVRRSPGRFEFHVIGDGPLREELEQLAITLELQDVVTFSGFQPEPLPFIRDMDIMVLTSDHEGLPMIALESLALGTPMACHAVGGLPHVMSSAKSGVLVHSQDPAEFAAAIEKLTRTPRATSRESLLSERFTARRCALAYSVLYRELLSTTKAQTRIVAD